jgi:hypothetical protein
MSRKLLSFFLFSLVFLAGISLATVVFAQGLDVGTSEIDSVIALSPTDPRVIIARIINVALLFLGAIAVALIIYSGFIWMTSGGSEDKIEQAKKILRNAIIGLIIILSAWGVVTFVLNRLMQATGTGGFNGGNNANVNSLQGTGALGACTIERVYPEPGQKEVARNSSIIISFKTALDLESVCQNAAGDACACDGGECSLINPVNIRIFRDDFGDDCDSSSCPVDSLNLNNASVSASSDRRTFIIKPNELLGKSDGNTDYSVYLSNGLLTDEGESIFKTCNNDFFTWGFEVSNQLDLTPPQVRKGGIFPLPDNEKDIFNQISAAIPATASIVVQACPQTYQAASVVSVSPSAGSFNATATVDPNYQSFANVSVVSIMDNSQAQLFAEGQLLGAAAWQGNSVSFPGFIDLFVEGHEAGGAWDVLIQPVSLADNLTIGTEVYNFSENAGANNIVIDPQNCSPSIVATAIYTSISGHPDINVEKEAGTVNLSAKVAGAAGNNIYLTSNNLNTLAITPFAGGQDLLKNNETKDRQDRPMNTVIQLNFNEAVNPLLIAGSADEVSQNIKVVNASASALASNASCAQDSDCLSYNCDNSVCVGDYLSGDFTVSNMYRTVEFRSDVACGQNACGDTIYCLPANSHLAVRLRAADLHSCQTNNDCSQFAPFSYCGLSNSFQVCQDENQNNYPVADFNNLNGVVDAATNSFDGNRNSFAEGPLEFYNENNPLLNERDNYVWTFHISDEMMTEPPIITFIKPDLGITDADTLLPVQINFNTLMMNDSLRTGSVVIDNGQDQFEHRLINLFSKSNQPLGYWVRAENKDVNPLDGEPDTTSVFVQHTNLAESVTYYTQLGSGVKDIYQNCFKPSAGLDCAADANNPSCCNGVPTALLGLDGNCP